MFRFNLSKRALAFLFCGLAGLLWESRAFCAPAGKCRDQVLSVSEASPDSGLVLSHIRKFLERMPRNRFKWVAVNASVVTLEQYQELAREARRDFYVLDVADASVFFSRTQILGAIAGWTAQVQPAAGSVIVFHGLEKIDNPRDVAQTLNIQRDLIAERNPFFVVFLIPPQFITIVENVAPDFLDWSSKYLR